MPRDTASVVDTYAALTVPSNIFSNVNLKPNKDLGVTSYDNAEMVAAMADVYHYAQQEVSFLRPLMPNAMDINSMFVKKNTFNKMQLVPKTDEAGFTPLMTPTSGARAFAPTIWHQGVMIDRDVDRNYREYMLTPQAQMELSKAIGRAYDIGIVYALLSNVLSYSSAAAKTFTGVKTASTVALPDAQYAVYADASDAFKALDTAFFDELVLKFEEDSIDSQNLWIIGGPILRRQLKMISDFRNNERTIAFMGNENARMSEWLGLKFIFLGPETKPASSWLVGKWINGAAAGLAGVRSSTASGYTEVTSSTSGFFNFIAADLSGSEWGDLSGANEMLTSERFDYSYAKQLYVKVAMGGMRVDDKKIRLCSAKS